MRTAWILFLGACGSSAAGPDLTVTTSFPVTRFTGANPSPLDPLMDQSIAFSIVWPDVDANGGNGTDPNCRSTGLIGSSKRTASGTTAATVTSEVLEPLEDWDVVLQLCSVGRSSLVVEAVIDRLNLGITCFGLPDSALAMASDGTPEVTSFKATMCNALILDVNDNRVVGNDNFELTIATGPPQLP